MELTPEEMYKLRTSKGLSQQQVADLIGVSQRSYSMYERGEMVPKHAKMVKLLEVLEVVRPAVEDKKCELCSVKDRIIEDLKLLSEQRDQLLKSKEELIQSQKDTIDDLRAIIEHYRSKERVGKKAG